MILLMKFDYDWPSGFRDIHVCKNEEDPIKNGGARVVTTLFINFSDAQGQPTPKSVMESCQNSNSSKL